MVKHIHMTTMKSTILIFLFCILGLFLCTAPAYAETSHVAWNVSFNKDNQMVSNYDDASIQKAIAEMQPGDTLNLTVTIANENSDPTNWYMTSQVLKTLEDTSKASNGAYSYSLRYNDTTLYSSELVGGDNSQGLKEVSGATGTWFFLSTLDSGQTGTVQIEMQLDGKTQGNAYMNTLGTLALDFAVELDGTTTATTGLAKTGDFTFELVFALAGIAALLLAFLSYRKDVIESEA